MKTILQEFEDQIKKGAYSTGTKREWGGAGVIFAAKPRSSNDFGDRIVVTPYVGQIARLIDALMPHFNYDHLSKFACYGQMAEAVAACPENASETDVLLAALHAVEEFIK